MGPKGPHGEKRASHADSKTTKYQFWWSYPPRIEPKYTSRLTIVLAYLPYKK